MAGAARRDEWLLPLVLVLAVACVFGRSVGFGFVIWDDPGNVAANPLLDPPTLRSLGHSWTHASQNYYVPVSDTVWWGIALCSRTLFGDLEPALFHAANLLLHALSVVLVFRWLCGLVVERRAACAGALLFALHPLQAESVCWVTELRGLLSAALGFGALLFALRGRQRIALLLFALALLAKPLALAFAALVIVQELGWRQRPWREVLSLYWPWIALALCAVCVALGAQSDEEARGVTPYHARPVLALDALGFYLAKLVWPVGLCADYGRAPGVVLDSLALWPAALALALAFGAALALPQRRRALCALAIFAVALLPTLGLVPFGFPDKSTVADRYAHVALAGAALGAALLVARFGRPALAGALALALACGVLSFVQASHWRDTRALFGRVLELNPGSFAAHDNLAADAVLRREYEVARVHYLRALEIRPRNLSALSNMAVCECELGLLDEGIVHLRQVIARQPGSADMRGNLVAALSNKGLLDEAENAARELAALQPEDVRNLLPLARVLRLRGQRAQAAELLERVQAQLPDWEPARAERAALGPP